MSGIYGSNMEDRHFENRLINHLDSEGPYENEVVLSITREFKNEDDEEEKIIEAIRVLEDLGFSVKEL